MSADGFLARSDDIDRLVITRVPALIGAGIPLFGPLPHDISLRQVATRSYNGGLVQSEYEVGGALHIPARKKASPAPPANLMT